MPLTGDDCRLLKQAVEMLDDDGKATVNEMQDVLSLVCERLTAPVELRIELCPDFNRWSSEHKVMLV